METVEFLQTLVGMFLRDMSQEIGLGGTVFIASMFVACLGAYALLKVQLRQQEQ